LPRADDLNADLVQCYRLAGPAQDFHWLIRTADTSKAESGACRLSERERISPRRTPRTTKVLGGRSIIPSPCSTVVFRVLRGEDWRTAHHVSYNMAASSEYDTVEHRKRNNPNSRRA
jgi:hypothetical protein